MNAIFDYLSIWELAHKWHGVVPSRDDDESVTREVRDTMLAILRAVLNSELGVYEELIGWTMEGDHKRDPLVFAEPLKIVPEEFERMYLSGILDRKELEYYRISLEGVLFWCARNDLSIPDFCVPSWAYRKPEDLVAVKPKVRPEAEDKAKCQEIAKRKWSENPRIRIAEMARDRDIRVDGNGGLYGEPTLLRWLREVAPEGVKGKAGRPRKTAEKE